jgi:hypothetical protein
MPTSTATRTRAKAPKPKQSKRGSCLGRYREDDTGAVRSIVALAGAGGSVVVVDRLAGTKADARVIACIAAEEDPGNASLIAQLYLADENRGRCRELTSEDLSSSTANVTGDAGQGEGTVAPSYSDGVLDEEGVRYSIRELDGGEGGAARELRWARRSAGGEWQALTLRETIGHFEDYEPFMAMAAAAVAANKDNPAIGVATLHCELRRQQDSPIVLNRGIRAAVLRAVNEQGLSLSEIAARCGRRHSGCDDFSSGDTTWLQRRIGVKKEAGSDGPTRWVHTDVLALIARDGLGLAPHEVEV